MVKAGQGVVKATNYLVRHVFMRQAVAQMSDAKLEGVSGVASSAISQWRYKCCDPRVSLLQAVGDVFGLELVWRDKTTKVVIDQCQR